MAEVQSRIVWWSSEWALRSDLRRGALPGGQLPPTSHTVRTLPDCKPDYVLAVNSTACVDITKPFPSSLRTKFDRTSERCWQHISDI